MARACEGTVPGSAPRPLRPLVGHARLTAAALRTIRRALDDDADFRALVLAATTEEDVGRAAWLFLDRPEGWEGELAALAASAAETSGAAHAAREERTAARRLRGAEEARRRVEVALEEARATAARAAADLADERRTRRAAEVDARAAADRVAELERERDEAAARAGELSALAGRVDELEAALAEARRTAPSTRVPEEVRAALADAAVAARALAEMLDDVLTSSEDGPEGAGPSLPAEPAAAVDRPPQEDGRRGRRPRRRPAPLPPGILDDSVEAAEHLVRCRDALLLVDGYNASLRYRPDLPIADLRGRFVDALDELVARTGVDVHVVFDGAAVSEGVVAGAARRGRARVSFSPPDTEADDVILGLVEQAPIGRPVLVASDDRRVREGAEQRGANVLSTRQLLAVLRRAPEG